MSNRFLIALSFPGEDRAFVHDVAEALAVKLTHRCVFYDKWYQGELAGQDGDVKLNSMYAQADLIVPIFSQHWNNRWFKREWTMIRSIQLDRGNDVAVVPVRLDDTVVPGWSSVDFSVPLEGRTPQQIADLLLEVLDKQVSTPGGAPFGVVGAECQPAPIRPLLRDLERALGGGVLEGSELGREVLATLQEEKRVGLTKPFNSLATMAGIRAADNYFTLIVLSAGAPDWQEDFSMCATPILVALARSLERSPDAQSVVLRLCDVIARQLRLTLIWPQDPDESNAFSNSIYCACLGARELECDAVLVALRGLKVVGPR